MQEAFREKIRELKDLQGKCMEPALELCMKIQRSTGDNGKKRECSDINQGGTAEAFRSLLQGWKVFFYVFFK